MQQGQLRVASKLNLPTDMQDRSEHTNYFGITCRSDCY